MSWSNTTQCAGVTYSGSVLPYKPQVVTEQGQNTDAEHGRHEKEKQDMEFGLSVWQFILGEEEIEKIINNKFTLQALKEKGSRGRER